jgi:hypothetical protein
MAAVRNSRSFDFGGEEPPSLRMTKKKQVLRLGCGLFSASSLRMTSQWIVAIG